MSLLELKQRLTATKQRHQVPLSSVTTDLGGTTIAQLIVDLLHRATSDAPKGCSAMLSLPTMKRHALSHWPASVLALLPFACLLCGSCVKVGSPGLCSAAATIKLISLSVLLYAG